MIITFDQLQALLADSERQKLVQKLSEANQQNRFLMRKVCCFFGFLLLNSVVVPLWQALVCLAEEIANSGIPVGTRKINGKNIQSHLLPRLEAMQEKLKEQMKDVEAAESKEVPLEYKVMGTLDGWSQGPHLLPEYMGSYTKFSTTLMLRPERYEIKFLADGEWMLSPEFPTVGEGLMENDLLIVE
ncbi:hypothetical protein MLD38_022822 [Melastoma candidum]|uniref:Uncharacterized protein n=1 Tax=Melastoma candidum TaxID=119954 RepID=A0ACB9QPH6_9MYRT|nr:hypothetical protein MLD38_022822 [Melastoma candidum]